MHIINKLWILCKPPKVWKTREAFDLHNKTQHLAYNLLRNTPGPLYITQVPYKCNHWEDQPEFANDLKLYKHIQTKHPDIAALRHRCQDCKAVYGNAELLLAHREHAHLSKWPAKFYWNQCDSKFHTKIIFDSHKKLHKDYDTIIFCEKCSSPFPSREAYKDHNKLEH